MCRQILLQDHSEGSTLLKMVTLNNFVPFVTAICLSLSPTCLHTAVSSLSLSEHVFVVAKWIRNIRRLPLCLLMAAHFNGNTLT